MAGVVGAHHRPIGTFNPAWCLRPQTDGAGDIVARWEDSPLSSLYGLSTFPFSGRSSRLKKSQPRRGMRVASTAVEPNSPKVGCMGQIKREKAGGDGSPLAIRTRLPSLRKLFAGRSVFPLSGVTVAASPPRAARAKALGGCGIKPAPVICLAELDPPLPVLKHSAADTSLQVSLWRRRCGEGTTLGGLDLQTPHMQLPPLCVYQAVAA